MAILKTPDIAANRRAVKWSRTEYLYRIFWTIFQFVFRISPRPFWKFRVWLLRLFGAKIGSEVHIYPSVKVFMPSNLVIGSYSAIGDGVELYNLGLLTIGNGVTISQHSYVCGGNHDLSLSSRPLLKCDIDIQDGAWICSKAFIGPNVNVGAFCVVGAGAVLVRNAEQRSLYAGNPAKLIKRYT